MASYEKRNNTWSVRFRVVVDGREVNKRLSGFKTRKEAENAYNEYVASVSEAENNDVVIPVCFSELVELYIDYSKPRMKESSFYSMMSKMRLHIIPTFSDFNIAKINPPVILKWQNSLAQYSFKYRQFLSLEIGIMIYPIQWLKSNRSATLSVKRKCQYGLRWNLRIF